jgi:hypothetical protein
MQFFTFRAFLANDFRRDFDAIREHSSIRKEIVVLLLWNNPPSLGCSDFDFFHILRYSHPSLTP